MRPRKYEGKIQSPALGQEATTRKKPSALAGALCAKRGVRAPYKRVIQGKVQRHKRGKLSLAPGGCPFHRFLCHPLVNSHRMGTVFVRSVRHHPSYTGQLQELHKPPSHLGLASKTRTSPGFFPSHASVLAVRSLTFEQWSRTCDRVIRAEP
jgi:hypothetical protein